MATTTTNQVEALQDRVADLERDMGALKAMLAERDAELQDARAQTAAAREELFAAADECAELRECNSRLKDEVGSLAMEVVVVLVVLVVFVRSTASRRRPAPSRNSKTRPSRRLPVGPRKKRMRGVPK